MGLFGPNVSRMQRDRDVAGLIGVLATGRASQREDAACALRDIGAPAVEPLMTQAEEIGEAAESTLAMIGPPALDPILRALKSGESRFLVTLALVARQEVPDSFSALCDLARDGENPDVRDAAECVLSALALDMMRPVPACGQPSFPEGDAKRAAMNRLDALQDTPVERWRACPACGSAITRILSNAVQCEHCSRCYTDAEYQPIVSSELVWWGQLEGSKPWTPMAAREAEMVGRPHPWLPLPPGKQSAQYGSFMPDVSTFYLLRRDRGASSASPSASTSPSAAIAGESSGRLEASAERIRGAMAVVSQFEAKYAFLYGKTHKPRTILGSMVTPWRDEGFSEPTFNELADTVDTLCSAWSEFRRTAAAQGLSWQEALRKAMPDLFSSESTQADGLREESVFAYAVVTSDEEVMNCFLWRLDEGYC